LVAGTLIAVPSSGVESAASPGKPALAPAPAAGVPQGPGVSPPPSSPAPGRSLSGIVSPAVRALRSDVVAVGKVEEAGGVEDLDFVKPYELASSRRAVQRLRIGLGRIYRDTVNGTPAQTNTVVDAVALHMGGADRTVVAYSKNQSGVFLMQRLPDRAEFLVTKWEPMINAPRVAMTADAERIPWGGVSNGLQIAVLSPWPTMAAGETVTLSLLAAVRNVSTGPILLNGFGGDGLVTCLVDGKPMQATVTPPAEDRGKDFGDGHVVVLRPNQIAFLAPDGGTGDPGFRVQVGSAETWMAQVVYESKRESRIGDRTLWAGRLESKPIEVKRLTPPPLYGGPRGTSGGLRTGPARPSVAPVPMRPAPQPKPEPGPVTEPKGP
jgi:hypothetical protein